MSTHSIVELLGRLNAAITLPNPQARALAYRVSLAFATREELVELCAVLSEGNAFGADAARAMAGVTR